MSCHCLSCHHGFCAGLLGGGTREYPGDSLQEIVPLSVSVRTHESTDRFVPQISSLSFINVSEITFFSHE